MSRSLNALPKLFCENISPSSAALPIFDPWVSLESVVFLLAGVGNFEGSG
jgi:hypothetical protein